MSRIHLVQSVIRKTGLLELVHYGVRSQTDRGWPTCHACRNESLEYSPPVDSVEMVDSSRTSMTILARHHGKEDVIRVDFGEEPSEEDMSQAWRGITFFHPVMARR